MDADYILVYRQARRVDTDLSFFVGFVSYFFMNCHLSLCAAELCDVLPSTGGCTGRRFESSCSKGVSWLSWIFCACSTNILGLA